MKKNLIFPFLFLLIVSFTGTEPVMKFESTKHNFGFVRQGEVVEYDYTFTNTGGSPLIISETKVECTCTSVDKPLKPVLPGEKANIHLKFDTKSTIDRQERTITVISNAQNSPATLVFKCIVLKKKK